MDLFGFLGIGLIVLGSLSGIAIYVDTFIDRANVTTLWWLFIFSICGGAVLYNLADSSSLGIVYSSYVLLLLGGVSAVTIFLTETGFFHNDEKSTLWVFFLIGTPLGASGIFFESIFIF